MAAQRPRTAPNARGARVSGAAFALGGAALVLIGIAAALTGTPDAAHDLAPLTGPGDLFGRFGQVAPIVSAAIAAVVAGVVGVLFATKRLTPLAAAMELLILGMAVEMCIGGATGRIGHATDGAVLGATVACLMGGTAILAGGIIAVLGHE
jgi:hypothetical protein